MTSQHIFIIAEAGVNHNGDLDKAFGLVDAAARAGADCIKFQTFEAGKLASQTAEKASYQKDAGSAAESQRDMLQRLELPRQWHHDLLKYCASQNIIFLSSAFDVDSLSFLVDELKLSAIKLGSGELTNAPLLYAVGRAGQKVILSTGMSTLAEVEKALGGLACGYLGQEPGVNNFSEAFASPAGRRTLANSVTLLHCVTEYPAPYEDINLQAMDTLQKTFDLPVGYSDHAQGIAVAIAAAACGAKVIEKHLTLDRSLPGPDHGSSSEPAEFKAMVLAIRQIEAALGNGIKEPKPGEKKNLVVTRKSLVAARPIRATEIFTSKNVAIKRPGDGRSPFEYWEILGQRADRDYGTDEPIA